MTSKLLSVTAIDQAVHFLHHSLFSMSRKHQLMVSALAQVANFVRIHGDRYLIFREG